VYETMMVNGYCCGQVQFDTIRVQQLQRIQRALQLASDGQHTSNSPLILLGDLNFRVEIFKEREEKIRGGRDFKEVVTELKRSNTYELFMHHDRLHMLLTHSHTLPCPSLLEGLTDGMLEAFQRGRRHNPTFTYPAYKPSPREYGDKRTPSWTDRVLWRGFHSYRTLTVNKDVVCSDHEPIAVGLRASTVLDDCTLGLLEHCVLS
jgi:hypothetical protein